MARVIYLRPEDDSLAEALEAAAQADMRSINSYAIAVLEAHLKANGHLG